MTYLRMIVHRSCVAVWSVKCNHG